MIHWMAFKGPAYIGEVPRAESKREEMIVFKIPNDMHAMVCRKRDFLYFFSPLYNYIVRQTEAMQGRMTVQ